MAKRSLKKKGKESQAETVIGRPVKYTPEWMEEEAQALIKWADNSKECIFYKSFAFERGYNPSRLAEFAAVSPSFSGALAYAKARQEQQMVTKALWNQTNPGFTKFFLINNHSETYSEKTTVVHQDSPTSQAMKKADGESKDLIPQ